MQQQQQHAPPAVYASADGTLYYSAAPAPAPVSPTMLAYDPAAGSLYHMQAGVASVSPTMHTYVLGSALGRPVTPTATYGHALYQARRDDDGLEF
jgi:hypothetical protein